MSDLKTILGEELFKQVSEKLGDKKIDIISGNYVPMDRFKAVNEAKNAAEQAKQDSIEAYEAKILELVNANKASQSEFEKQIKDLSSKGLKADEYEKQIKQIMEDSQKQNSDFENKIKSLSEENIKAREQFEKELQDRTLNQATKAMLKDVDPKYHDFILGKIDRSKLILDDDNVIGLADQLAPVQQEFPECFGVKVSGNTPVKGDVNPPLDNVPTDDLRKAFGLS